MINSKEKKMIRIFWEDAVIYDKSSGFKLDLHKRITEFNSHRSSTLLLNFGENGISGYFPGYPDLNPRRRLRLVREFILSWFHSFFPSRCLSQSFRRSFCHFVICGIGPRLTPDSKYGLVETTTNNGSPIRHLATLGKKYLLNAWKSQEIQVN